MTLRSLPLRPVLETSTDELVREFYIPALSASFQYDRGVGYFTSAWLRLTASGLSSLAANSGTARIIASPKLDPDDWAALLHGVDAREDAELRRALQRTLDDLEHGLETDTLATLAWMVADGLLDFRIAIPAGDLDGDFHDKFGIFRDQAGDAVAFHGSANDSERAFRNYESVDVFYSWADERDAARVRLHQARFERIWENADPNIRVFTLPEAIRRNLVEFTSRSERPYPTPKTTAPAAEARWRHQRLALAEFLKRRRGVLEMATGTGKTRTALMILHELHSRGLIETALVAAYGTDLLDQWYRQLITRSPFPIYRAYDSHRGLLAYANNPRAGLLLVSRQLLPDVLPRLSRTVAAEGLIVCDEVHGLGSPALVAALEGQLQPFKYRLGLSATPEREYDAEGNIFIEREIGPVIFRFGLTEAIERGILCEFDYIPLQYEFSDEDRAAVQRVIARYHARVKQGETIGPEALYQEIARVRKLSTQKLTPFRTFVRENPNVLERCLIFVETAEYGLQVQEILMEFSVDFHTYYGEDDRVNLTRFARDELACLITCHRVSEGIDIQSVNNVVLFASSRARLETIQRLGRCLRTDPKNPQKRANVIDFIRVDDIGDDTPSDPTTDLERMKWLSELAATRRASSEATLL